MDSVRVAAQIADMARAPLDVEIAETVSLCRRLGLGEVAPVLLAAAHHSILTIASLGLVARVQSAEALDTAWRTARREIAVARHLARRGAPAIAPLGTPLAGPHRTPATIVTLWPRVERARPADETDAPAAAKALRAVHEALHGFADTLPRFTAMLDRCRRLLSDDRTPLALSAADRALLASRYRDLRATVEASPGAWVPLHGDPHLGNVLIASRGPVWIDFEDACIGPREWDVAALPPEVWPRFGSTDETLLRCCADLRSVCVAVWCAADPSRSPAMREAAAYHLDRVRDRHPDREATAPVTRPLARRPSSDT